MEHHPREPEIDPGDSVPARFEAMAAAQPERDAIRSRGQIWRYGELNRAANHVTHALLRATTGGDAPIALVFAHHGPAVATILGVLKAGKCYVCLDPAFPPERNASILADSGARLILCDLADLSVAAALAGDGQGLLIFEDLHGGLPTDDPGVPVRADMDLGIFYTSGSTGTPKGVLWRHDICLHRMAVDRQLCPLLPADRLTLLTPLVFPAATSDVFWALLNGACLCLFDIRERGTAGFPDWLRDQEITCMRSPVALFRHLLESMPTGLELPALRRIVLSGDTLYARDVERARLRLPACAEIVHRYSMSEAGLVCVNTLARDTEIGDGIVPVGHPVPGKQVRLFGPEGAPLAGDSAEAGEIGVSSRYLAAGYRGRPEATRARFVADPEAPGHRLYLSGDLGRFRPDGSLEFLGRRDHRLKIRGYRVEVAAVEAALLGQEGVDAAAVVPWPDASGEKSLVAHVVPRPDSGLEIPALRRRLTRALPDYMIPARFILRDALPLTPGGKIDRQALSILVQAAPAPPPTASGPLGPTEERIAGIWRDVLRLDQLGGDDDFFSLGGHSLLAARVVARLNEAFHLSLPLASFYQAPTVSGLAAMVERGETAAPSRDRKNAMDLARALSLLEAF